MTTVQSPALVSTDKTSVAIRTGHSNTVAHFNASLHQLRLSKEGQADTKIELGFSGSKLLERLLRLPGEVISREELIAYAWPERVVGQGSLNQQIYTLRQILGDEKERDIIQTLPRRGYLFNPDFLFQQPATVSASLPPTPVIQEPVIRKSWKWPLTVSFAAMLSGFAALTVFHTERPVQQLEHLTVALLSEEEEPVWRHIEPTLARMAKLANDARHVALGHAGGYYHVHCIHGKRSHSLAIHLAQLDQVSDQLLLECLQ